MRDIYFDDFAELGNYIYETVLEGNSISAVLLYDETIEMMKWLFEYDDIKTGNILIERNYGREYYVTLKTDFTLDIEPVFDMDGNIQTKNVNEMLFCGDVANSIALHNSDCEQYEIRIEKDDDCGDCCFDCSNCPHKNTSEALTAALDFVDYLFNHFDE